VDQVKVCIDKKPSATASGLGALPRSVWALGLVSLLMDTSSELIHSLLPVFLVTVLGASVGSVGVIERIAEATASRSKIFSGAISDYFGRRKPLVVVGYGLAALTKPLFPLASSISFVLLARFVDRVGKGIREAPRDALIADVTPEPLRGRAYGLRQALDTVGAFTGPLAALAAMAVFADNIRTVFWLAVLPGGLALAVLVWGVEEPQLPPLQPDGEPQSPIRLIDLRKLELAFWMIVTVGAVLTLARFSEAFLLLRAQSVGLPAAYVPLILIVMNVVYAASAYPAGIFVDRLDRQVLLAVGCLVLIGSNFVLGLASRICAVMAGVALWGLHMGLTQGLLSAMLAGAAPPALRGSAFGIFNLISGIMLLVASTIAGLLWDWYGASATFYAGAIVTTIGFAGMALTEFSRKVIAPTTTS
jgi:MFS family permease